MPPAPENPRVTAEQYLKRFALSDLFDYLLSQIVLELPDDPWKRLSEVCEDLDNKHAAGEVPFFSKGEIEAIFSKYEVLNRGYVSGAQAKQALRTMGLEQDLVDSLFINDESKLTKEAFCDVASTGLSRRLQRWYGK